MAVSEERLVMGRWDREGHSARTLAGRMGGAGATLVKASLDRREAGSLKAQVTVSSAGLFSAASLGLCSLASRTNAYHQRFF